MARVATNIQKLPGILEVGMVPGSRPPAMLVRFDPRQTSAEAIAQRAKEGLESDAIVPTTYAVSFAPTDPLLLAVERLDLIRYFHQMELLVRVEAPGMLKLNTELFGCGTCTNLVLDALGKLGGVLEARRQSSPAGPEVVVAFDPAVVDAEAIAVASKDALESDELLETSVAIRLLALETGPAFRLGFGTLAALIPQVVGRPLEPERYAPNGDSLQRTTTGLMVWRKADNWTAFTDGSRTWVLGPYGLQERGNDERFDWERAE